jgi:hypothetical protein
MSRQAMMAGLIGATMLGTASWVSAAAPTTAPGTSTRAVAIGRWNLTVDNHPAWLAIEMKGDKRTGRFLGGAGSVHGIGEVKIDDLNVTFNAGDRKWVGKVEGDAISGTWEKGAEKGTWSGTRSIIKSDLNGAWAIKPVGVPTERPAVAQLKQTDDKVTGTYQEGGKKYDLSDGAVNAGFVKFAVTSPSGKTTFWGPVKGDLIDGGIIQVEGSRQHRAFKAYRQRQWGDPIEVFNGKDLDNWTQFGEPKNWKVVDGVMTTTGGANIVSKEKFRDFRLHVEFMVPPGGNSGVYLRGRHEIQVADSIGGNPPSWHDCGALYSRIAPAVNACRKADTWQTFDITLVNNYLTVILNGQIIIDNEEVEGITGGMLDNKENEPGPIYLQGDHGKISYRKITVWSAK